MSAIYVDTSILVAMFFEGPTRYPSLLQEIDTLMSSALIEAEFLSVIAREKADINAGLRYLKQISLVAPDRSLSKELEYIFSKSYVRGADAFHLACALYLDPKGSELKFLTADKQQEKAAQAIGFTLA
jgi:predicted nucleic acid-binding protein